MKNLVYIVAIGMEVKEHTEKAWKFYCEKYNCDFKVITKASRKNMAPHWERYTIFEKYPGYDKYLYVDADAMVKWDAPNFFETVHYTPSAIHAVKDIGSLEWVYNSILGYQDLFPNQDLKWWEYVTTGWLLFDNTLKDFFTKVMKFHAENNEELNLRQYNTLKKGFDQTPVNYLIRQENIQLKVLPEVFSLAHLHKKDIFQNGMFVNLPAYIWQFNGIPKEQLPYIMEQLWNHVKDQYK